MKPSLWHRINPFKIMVKLCLYSALALSVVLIVFRYIPVPTSAFIMHQNMLAKKSPLIYQAARHQWVDYQHISPHLIKAVIASEDQRFLLHYGFDTTQIKAAWGHYQQGKKLRGASTITQQLAKNLFLWSDRSLLRKGLETLITPFIELWWSKQRILEVYLNMVQFGPVTYGVKQASIENFHIQADAVSASQAAWMIAVLPAPGKSHIKRPSPSLRKRHDRIVKQMKVLTAFGLFQNLRIFTSPAH